MFHRLSSHEPLEKTVFAANPLVASVLRENVRVTKKRALIGLWPHWQSLLGQVNDFGRVLSIGRNGYAVLGRIGAYPEMVNAACGHCACGADGSMEFYFSGWHRAVVVIEEQPTGWLYSVEFYDSCGETLHKICLTGDSDFEAFRDWVELHQTVDHPALTGDFSPRGQEEASAAGFPADAILLRAEAVPVLLQGLIAEKRAAQFVVGNDGFVQGADIRPLSLQENGQWLFASDEDCGLHLRHARLTEVYLLPAGRPEFPPQWVLKAHDPEGRLVCAVTAPRRTEANGWNEFLIDATASYHLQKTEL